MLSFKQFIRKTEKIPTGMVIHGIKNGPIKKKPKNPYDIKESPEEDLHNELSQQYNFTPKQQQQIRNYSVSSFPLNASLLGYHHLGQEPKKSVHGIHIPTLDSVVSNPIGRKLTVFSGLGFDPRKRVNSSGELHVPPYLSTSTDLGAATRFANSDAEYNREPGHILKLDLEEHNKGAYLGDHAEDYSDEGDEKEFLLPRNSTVTIHRSEVQPDGTTIHHGTVRHDVDPSSIERDTKHLKGLHPNFFAQMFHRDSGISERNKKILAQSPHVPQQYTQKFDLMSRLSSKKATSDDIEEGLNHEDEEIAKIAAAHPNATAEHVTKALNRGQVVGSHAIKNNPNVTSEQIDRVVHGNYPTFMSSDAIRHPNASPANIDKALDHENDTVREYAIRHPNASSENIDKAMRDPSDYIRQVAISHPNATRDHLTKALSDSSEYNRNRAAELLKTKT